MSRRMLGVGNMGAGAIRCARHYGMDGAFVDIDPARRESITRTLDIPSYTSLDEALAAHDDWAGAYIATPNHTHAEMAIRLAPLGIPVLMEKPLGVNREECDRVVAAWRDSAGWLQIDFEYRFSALYEHAGRILDSGEMGELRSVYFEYTRGGWSPDHGWRLDPEHAGGLFCENLCHVVDLFRFWTHSEPAEMQVVPGPRGIPHYSEETTDNLTAHFVMESGVLCNLVHTHGSVAMPLKGRQDEADWREYGHRLACYLNTTLGCIRIDVWDCSLTLIVRDPADACTPRIRRQISYRHIPFNEAHHDMSGMVRDFVRRVHEGAGPRLDMEDSYKTMLAVFECDRQLREKSAAANARFDGGA